MRSATRGPIGLCAAVFGALMVSIPADLAARPRSPEKSAGHKLQAREGGNREFNRKAKTLVGNGGEPLGESEASDGDASPTSAAEEKAAQRAYPLDAIPLSATLAAIDTWSSYGDNQDGTHSGNNVNQPFVWDLQGPTHALQPGILSFSGAQFHMAGRVTALAITPTCTPSSCRLWMAAAGGGVWRTDNPLSPAPDWVFTSSVFKTNAVGTIDQDPADPSGNTLYAGTGEANASGDSESGVGIYKTTDGGDHWTFLTGSSLFATRSISRLVASGPRILAGIARGVRGISSVTGGAVSRTQGPSDGGDQAPLGLYESTDGGASFHIIWNTNGSIRGVNNVAVDANDGGAIYVAAFQRGIFRCSPIDGCNPAAATSAQFRQVFAGTSPLQNTNRTEFALTSVPQAAGPALTRIYVLDGAVGRQFVRTTGGVVQTGFPSQIWRADAANTLTAAALRATEGDPNARDPGPNTGAGWARKSTRTSRPAANPYRPAYNICQGQCWYDAFIYTPHGFPDIVYAGGSYAYGELHERSNGRGVILSITAGDPDATLAHGGNFSDMTWDDTPGKKPDQTHPDQHALITPSGQPFLFFEGSDGGMIRSNGSFDDASADCIRYHVNDADTLIHCQNVLSRVPHQLFDTLNMGLSTLQFQSVSLNPFRPLHNVQGGTQDNGTFDWESQLTTWDEEIYGDGGQSGYNYGDDTIRFNTFFGYYTDENFRGGQPDKWVVTSGPLSSFNNGESSPFYMAIVSDYTNYGFQYAGLQHVWRTVDNGGPQAYLEANCPEFTASGDDPACGDWRPLGDPAYAGPGNVEAGKPGDLTSILYGADRKGGVVAAVERSPGDDVTLWAATSTGRVFVSHNANAADSGAVTFCRIDNAAPNSPPRFVTSIYPDPADANHAWISYSGYNQATPAFVGHAFEVTATGANQAGCPVAATWRDLGVEQGSNAHFFPGDIPVTDLVRDDLTGDLYAATDFGVLRSAGGAGFNWTKAGTNLPFVEVAGLTIDPCSRALYGATHGRSIWRMFLPAAAGAPSSACPRTP